mmetsp:Transcript_40738/g.87455  ORF Transcript_40738/g.87455 Transcript_40738/m.87455 type:complete len:400 (-) Transcript_40738:1083-2282(-)
MLGGVEAGVSPVAQAQTVSQRIGPSARLPKLLRGQNLERHAARHALQPRHARHSGHHPRHTLHSIHSIARVATLGRRRLRRIAAAVAASVAASTTPRARSARRSAGSGRSAAATATSTPGPRSVPSTTTTAAAEGISRGAVSEGLAGAAASAPAPEALARAPTSSRRGRSGGQASKLRRNRLTCLFHHLHNLVCRATLILREERDCSSLSARSPGSTDAVHIVLCIAGRIEVHNHSDTLNIKTSCRNIGSDQNPALSTLEAVQRPVSLHLVAIAVDSLATNVHARDRAGQLIAHLLGFGEDYDLPFLDSLPKNVQKSVFLVPRVPADHDLLVDVGVRLQFIRISDAHLNGVSEELGGQSSNLFRPSCCEHQSLAPRRDVPDDLPNLRFESHVQHSVSLI